MTDVLTARAEAHPDKIAVIDDRPGEPVRSMTFAEFNVCAARLANGMVERGVRPGDRVVWCGQNSLELLAMMHAARKAKVTAVPLNYRLSDEESVYVVDNSDAVLVWADAEYAPLFARIRDDIPKVRDVVIFGGDPLDGQLAEAALVSAVATDPEIDADTAATMIYTSGTTGVPKGAYRKSQAMPAQRKAMFDFIGYTADDVYITCGPLYHSGPGGFAGFSHAMGNTIVLQHKFDAEDWIRLVSTHRATHTFSAPTPIRKVTNLPAEVKERYDVSSMRIMMANAAPWPFPLKQAYVADFPPESLWECYGSTEMGVNTLLGPDDQLRKPGSCGLPAPMVEVALFDDDGNEITEPNVPGELWVRASTVIETYHGAQEKFDSEHRSDGYHTVGDIAYRDDEGYLFICDRKKDMIISGGMNIYPAEIEAALEQHPGIYEAAVFGIPSEEWGESVHACVVRTDNDGIADEAAVEAHARDLLAGYKVPRSVEFLDEIPKTGSNKILKRELRAKYWDDTRRI